MNTNFDFSKFKNKASWKRAAAFFLSMVLLLTGIAIPDFPLYGSMTAHASASGDARGAYYKMSSFPISYLEQEEIHTITAEGKLGSVNTVTWYQFTPAETAEYAFWGSCADNSYLDTYGSVYTKNTEEGCYEQLTSDDDGYGNGQFRVYTTLNAGTTYYLCAGYYDYNNTGEYEPSFCKSQLSYVTAKINGIPKTSLTSKYGKSYVLEAEATCEGGVTPTYEWYTFDDSNNKTALPGTGSTYTYRESGTANGNRQICCTVTSGMESMTLTFNIYYRPFLIRSLTINGDKVWNWDWFEFQMNRTYELKMDAFCDAGNTLTYKWSAGNKVLQTGESSTLSFTPTKELLSEDSKNFSLTCEVSDANGLTETYTVTFYYVPIGATMEVNGEQTNGMVSVFRGVPYTLKINATAEAGKHLTYEWRNVNDFDSILGTEPTYQYTMGNEASDEIIICTVSDGSETNTYYFNLMYDPLVSTSLTVNGSSASGNAIPVHAGETYEFKVSVEADPNVEPTYQWGIQEKSGPNKGFSPLPGKTGDTYTCRIDKAADLIPKLMCRITTADGSLLQQRCYMRYTPIYDVQPSINGIPNNRATTRAGEKYTLAVKASCEPGKSLTYEWYEDDTKISDTSSYTYTAAENDSHWINCRISDGTNSRYESFSLNGLDSKLYDFTINGASTNVAYAYEGEKVTLEFKDKTEMAGEIYWQWDDGNHNGYTDYTNKITVTMGKDIVMGYCSWDDGITYFTLLPTTKKPDDQNNQNKPNDQNKPCTSHTYVSKLTKAATISADGEITNTCSKCGHTEKSAIAKISDVRLSKTSLDYNGKKQSLALTVKDRTGKQLKAGTDYDCTLNGKKADAIAARDVGKYTVKVTFKGSYSGSKELSFTILPKKTSLTKVSAAKKGFKAVWKKQKAQVTGYEICYSTKKNFQKKTTKSVLVKSYKTTSTTIKKLKAKTTYYVKIRTYKNVKAGKKTVKLYSKWSAAKTVKTKK